MAKKVTNSYSSSLAVPEEGAFLFPNSSRKSQAYCLADPIGFPERWNSLDGKARTTSYQHHGQE